MTTTITHKVVAYITWKDKLLVFSHTEHPEAGIQVPAGTIEPGETPDEAVLREAHEETGLKGLALQSFLAVEDYDLAEIGHAGIIHRRYYYHLTVSGQPPERWLHHELDASDGHPDPIEFELFWVKFPDDVPPLAGRQGDFLHRLLDSSG